MRLHVFFSLVWYAPSVLYSQKISKLGMTIFAKLQIVHWAFEKEQASSKFAQIN